MKHSTSFLLLICCLFSVTTYAQTSVSKTDALAIAQRQFQGQDVDYFILEDNSQPQWNIFVDAEPLKGWEHDCYILTIPKTITTSVTSAVPSSKKAMKMPPTSGNYVPLLVKNRYGNVANTAPVVAKDSNANSSNPVASRTYAIILSGGVSKYSNYSRYWNDCSFIYQTLVNKYGVPKNNIYPIMADGNDPAADMMLPGGSFVSQPLDLDGDNVADIKLSATVSNISNTLNSLKGKLQKDDHLFIFVIDHGGRDANGNSYICLWNSGKLYASELANMLTPFSEKLVNINVVLGQCFAGGFNSALRKTGCVVASACRSTESSYACPDIPYDEFVYHWTCAVNGADHRGKTVNADDDNNGKVTMKEAFDYAWEKDRQDETPRYNSTPRSVGEDLAFNYLAPSVDIYIKDNSEDYGKEPNTTTDKLWKSPSIWVRNYNDSIYEHQNPVFSKSHDVAYIYVRVHNRGKEDFIRGGRWLHVYWALASTGINAQTWKGREIFNGEDVTGDHLQSSYIDTIPAAGYKDFEFIWDRPNVLNKYPDGDFHFCLLAKIMDTPYDDGYKDGVTYVDLGGRNDHAQKNVTLISKNDVAKGVKVFVRNVLPTVKDYSLEFVPQKQADADLYTKATVELEMTPKIYAAWQRGGCKSQDVEICSGNSNGGKVKFLSTKSQLQSVKLNESEFDIVTIKFNFTSYPNKATTYTYDLIQKDENGEIIGGETFIVEAPVHYTLEPNPPIIITPITGGQFELVANQPGSESYEWFNSRGESLGQTESITVIPRLDDNSYSVVAKNEEGDVTTQSVSLESDYGIKSVSISGGIHSIVVDLQAEAPDNAVIAVTSVLDGSTKLTSEVQAGVKTISLNSGDLSQGIYAIIYKVDGNIIDQEKVTIK